MEIGHHSSFQPLSLSNLTKMYQKKKLDDHPAKCRRVSSLLLGLLFRGDVRHVREVESAKMHLASEDLNFSMVEPIYLSCHSSRL